MFVFEDGELGGALGAPLTVLQPLHARPPLPDLRVQRPEDVATHPERGLAGVEALDGEEEGLQPLLLLPPGPRVQLHALGVVPHVESVGRHQVVPLEHLRKAQMSPSVQY